MIAAQDVYRALADVARVAHDYVPSRLLCSCGELVGGPMELRAHEGPHGKPE